VHEYRAGLVAEGLRCDQSLVDRVPVETHIRAVRAGRLDLGDGSALRHEHRCPDAEQRGRQGNPLRVVAGARGDDAAGGFVRGQPGNTRVGAADLERPRALQVLALEPDRPADPFRERARPLHWSVEDDPAQQLARRAYVVKGDACGCG